MNHVSEAFSDNICPRCGKKLTRGEEAISCSNCGLYMTYERMEEIFDKAMSLASGDAKMLFKAIKRQILERALKN